MRQTTSSSELAVPLVSAHWLQPFVRELERQNAPVDQLLARANVPSRARHEPDLIIPELPVWRLLEIACLESGQAGLGFKVGQAEDLDSVESFSQRLDRAVSVMDIARIFAAESPDSGFHMRRGRNRAWFCRRGLGCGVGAFTMEQYAVTLMIQAIRRCAGPAWSPDRVRLQCADTAGLDESSLLEGARISFDHRTTAVAVPLELLGTPGVAWTNVGPDTDWVVGLSKAIEPYLSDGYPGVRLAAEILGTSSRTLQRRLAEEGLSYSDLVRLTRLRAALGRISDERAQIIDIAYDLGYRDPGSFSRAFRAWTGFAPREYRHSRRRIEAPA